MGVQTTFPCPETIDFKPFLDKSTHYAVADEKYFDHGFNLLQSAKKCSILQGFSTFFNYIWIIVHYAKGGKI